MSADVAVVVVTRDAKERALATLRSFGTDPDRASWDVVVVDNASSDGTAPALRDLGDVRLLRNDVGRGYAGALNQAIAVTTAPYVAVMTAGTLLSAGSLGALVRALEDDQRVAAVGPLIRHPDGRVQRHGLFRPRPYTAFVVLFGLARLGPFRREAERYYGSHEAGPPRDVDQLTGACVVLRRSALDDVGGFDEERFFLYCEDVDWCLRARARGWLLRFAPDVHVTRTKSSSSRRESAATIRLYYRSLRRFYDKHSADPAIVRSLFHAAAYAKESIALAANVMRREKGLRY